MMEKKWVFSSFQRSQTQHCVVSTCLIHSTQTADKRYQQLFKILFPPKHTMSRKSQQISFKTPLLQSNLHCIFIIVLLFQDCIFMIDFLSLLWNGVSQRVVATSIHFAFIWLPMFILRNKQRNCISFAMLCYNHEHWWQIKDSWSKDQYSDVYRLSAIHHSEYLAWPCIVR